MELHRKMEEKSTKFGQRIHSIWTRLDFSLTSNRYIAKGDSCHGGKMSKMHRTVLLYCNSYGSEKPLVVGKSKNPRCFKNTESFLTKYKANKKAWIIQALFEDFLHKLKKKKN